MRNNFPKIVNELMRVDKKIFCVLGDIGVHSFRNIFHKYKNRILNIGTLEQSMIGIAAGLSKGGFIPIVHTISPFITLRALEQIKIDFVYNKLNCNLITVGGSNDYSKLGVTHHCFEDIHILSAYEDINLFVPTNGKEFEYLFKKNYKSGINYFRIISSKIEHNLISNCFIKKNFSKKLIIFFGFYSDYLIQKDNYDIYYVNNLSKNTNINFVKKYKKIYVIESFFGNILENFIYRKNIDCNIKTISFKKTIIRNYGTKEQQDRKLNFDMKKIINSIDE